MLNFFWIGLEAVGSDRRIHMNLTETIWFLMEPNK